MNLIYVCNGIGSVFDSQVLALLNYYAKNSDIERIVLFFGYPNDSEKEILLQKQFDNRIELLFFKSYPNYPIFNFLIRKNLFHLLKMIDINFSKTVFHIRGEVLAWNLYLIQKKLNLQFNNNLVDIRGASKEEVEEYFDIDILRKRLKLYNYKRALRNLINFSSLSVVSNALKNYLIINYHINENKIHVVPTLVDKFFDYDEIERRKKRYKLGIKKNEILFVFSSGGVAKWQNNSIIEIIAQNNYKVLNLSKKLIRNQNVINKFIPYNEIYKYLSAADVAIIWREKSVVNKVASPVKFSEYVCCGLPVVSNNNVDLIKNFIKNHNCGLLIKELEYLKNNEIKNLLKLNRLKISREGKVKFGIKNISSLYLNVYDNLILR